MTTSPWHRSWARIIVIWGKRIFSPQDTHICLNCAPTLPVWDRHQHPCTRTGETRRRRRGRIRCYRPGLCHGHKTIRQGRDIEYVRWAKENLSLPWFAIGGINLSNLDDVLNAGAQRICVVSAILNSTNIATTCREFRRRMDGRVGDDCPEQDFRK